MELLVNILFWVGVWIISGITAVFMETFILFRGPTHKIQMCLLHPKYKVSMARCIQSLSKKENIIFRYVVLNFIYGAIFMPLAVLELILSTISFIDFNPSKYNKGV